jgi:hypothetical protein
MLELIIIGLVFWLGYQIGMSVTAYRLRFLVYKEARRKGLLKEMDLSLEEEIPVVNQLVVEKANNILYLYNKEDKTFICQATTLSELAKLAKQYKNIKYAAVVDGDDVYAFVNGLVKPAEEVLK